MASTNALFHKIVLSRDFSLLDDVYTADARILPPGAPLISGREAIKKFWSDMVASVNATSVVLTSDDVMAAGDGVVEIGHATLGIDPTGGSPAQVEVKYVVYWRQENSRWKWHVDIWNHYA